MTKGYQERTYRRLVRGHLDPLQVTVQETDLSVYADHIGVEMTDIHRGDVVWSSALFDEAATGIAAAIDQHLSFGRINQDVGLEIVERERGAGERTRDVDNVYDQRVAVSAGTLQSCPRLPETSIRQPIQYRRDPRC